jgi:hypothetical protein
LLRRAINGGEEGPEPELSLSESLSSQEAATFAGAMIAVVVIY